LAAGNLRSLTKKKQSDQSGSCFQNGFLVGIGLVFSVQGLIRGAQLLFHEDAAVRQPV
jgi:xenotropic and polytropic retrovirus receptor 1